MEISIRLRPSLVETADTRRVLMTGIDGLENLQLHFVNSNFVI